MATSTLAREPSSIQPSSVEPKFTVGNWLLVARQAKANGGSLLDVRNSLQAELTNYALVSALFGAIEMSIYLDPADTLYEDDALTPLARVGMVLTGVTTVLCILSVLLSTTLIVHLGILPSEESVIWFLKSHSRVMGGNASVFSTMAVSFLCQLCVTSFALYPTVDAVIFTSLACICLVLFFVVHIHLSLTVWGHVARWNRNGEHSCI